MYFRTCDWDKDLEYLEDTYRVGLCEIFFLNMAQVVRVSYGFYDEPLILTTNKTVYDFTDPEFVPITGDRIPDSVRRYLDKHYDMSRKLALEIMGI